MGRVDESVRGSLPMIDWHENCSGDARRWLAQQEWIPPGDITVEDDGVVMSMVGHGVGAAIGPKLSTVGAPAKVATAEFGDGAPQRCVGYVTTPELAGDRSRRPPLGSSGEHSAHGPAHLRLGSLLALTFEGDPLLALRGDPLQNVQGVTEPGRAESQL